MINYKYVIENKKEFFYNFKRKNYKKYKREGKYVGDNFKKI